MRIFEEIQKFDQWWFRLLIIAALGVTVGAMAVAYPTVADEEMSSFLAVSIPTTVFMVVFTYIMLTLKLKTRIDETGIHYGFLPFQPSLRTATWQEIAKCDVISYSPMRDYGGWGYKFSLSGKGKVYSTKGNKGIKIVFQSGKKTMVGTQRPHEVQSIIHKYFQKTAL